MKRIINVFRTENVKAYIKKTVAIGIVAVTFTQFIGISSFAKNKAECPSGLDYGDVGRTIEEYVDEHKDTTAAMSMAVYDRDGIIYSNQFGYVDKEASNEATENTVYEWGSTSKLMVWISVMQLYEQGKIDLDKDIKEYLPQDFLRNLAFDKPITMIDLMNHQAGFQEMYIGVQTIDEEAVINLEDALTKYQPKQIYEPGTVTAYSNWGAALAAYIVQNISGEDYVEYVHDNILDPLGMKHTSIDATASDNEWVKNQKDMVKYYDIDGDILPINNCYINLYPAGSACSTKEDFLTFARAITPDSNKKCVLFNNSDTMDIMYTATSYYGDSNVPNNYHGFFASQYEVETLGHGGNTFGSSAMIQFDPVSGIGMVVMTNQSHEQNYNYKMYDLIFGKFTDSKLGQSQREVPKGLILTTRTIKEGPLSMMGAIGFLSYGEEDLESWWYQDGNYVYGGYQDSRIATNEIIRSMVVVTLFAVATLYGLTTISVGGLVVRPISKKIKMKKCTYLEHKSSKWNYIMSSIMAVIGIDMLAIFMRISKGVSTGDMGELFLYQIQSAIILAASLGLIVGLIIFIIKIYKKCIAASRGERIKCIVTVLMSMCMLVAVVMFDMYQFWAF